MAKRFGYSRGVGLSDNHPQAFNAESFRKFVAALDADRAPRKENAPYICGPFNGDGHRSAETAEPRAWLAVDLDRIEAERLPDVRIWFRRFSGTAWPTHSSTPTAPRERVIIELDRPANRDECIAIGAALKADLTEEFGAALLVDDSTFRPEQPVFVAPLGVQFARFEGEPLNVDRYLANAPRVDKPSRSNDVRTIDAGGRNKKLTSIAGTLRRDGLSAVELEAALLAVNDGRCNPPLGDDEVRSIARSVGRYNIEQTAEHAPGGAPCQDDPLPLIWTSDVSAADVGLPELVEDIFTRSGLSVTYGPSGGGKSYLSLHMDCAIPRGVDVLGKRTTPGLVVYVAGEGAASIKRRLAAYKQHHGLTDFPLAIVPCAINLLDPSADVARVIDAIKRAEDHYGIGAAKTTIDTLARAFGGGNENSSEDMGAVIRNADAIRNQIDHHVNFVHHSGKDESKGSRGHSSLRAAIDTEVECSDNGNRLHTLEIVKQRDLGSLGLRLSARFVPMGFGFDQWGKPLTVCVLEDADAVPRPADARKLGKNQTLLLDRLRAGGPMSRHEALAYLEAAGVTARRSRYSAIDSLLLAGVIEDTVIGLRAKE